MLSQLIVALLLIGAAFAIPKYSERIVGGTDATIEQYPFFVSIRDSNSNHMCGGTILDEYWILTSAGCLDMPNKLDFTVQIGRTDISREVDDSVYSIDQVILHPLYDEANNQLNDIGLIKLRKPVVFCTNVQPVKLAKDWCEECAENLSVTAIGWGSLEPQGSATTRLQQLDYFVVPNEECRKRLSCITNIYPSQICAGGAGKGMSVYDWGGPLLHDGIQVGINSYSFVDKSRLPDGFTKVSDYIDFIDSSIPKRHVQKRTKIHA